MLGGRKTSTTDMPKYAEVRMQFAEDENVVQRLTATYATLRAHVLNEVVPILP